jgi:hypothetical protein
VTFRSAALLCAAAVGAGGLVALPGTPAVAAAAVPGHDRVVSAVPQSKTPNVQDESVDAIFDAGQKIIAGGGFTRVRSAGASKDDLRQYIFAFDETTGVVDQAFAPLVDGVITTIIGGPTPGTVFIGGRFGTVGDVKRNKVALLNVSDGSVVTGFKAPSFNGAVTDLALAGNRLLVGGSFTLAGGGAPPSRPGLASLNATTGALDSYLTVALTENHSWTAGSVGVAKAPVGVEKMTLSPDGTKLVVIGNFRKANGVSHDQVVKINLGETAATLSDWDTDRYQPLCNPSKFDSYVRDVAFSPDSKYFVTVTTGGGVEGTLCDTAARWEAGATGTGQLPTWVAYSGGDTLLSTAVSEQAVYIGGHMRWMNNDLGRDAARAGAVARASIAALDPLNGMPMAWNPGRNPRGYGVTEIHLSAQGMWIGHDQEWIGNQEYKHDRIAFFPVAGGQPAHPTATRSLPGNVYTLGADGPAAALFRVNAGGDTIVAADGGPNWQADTQAAPSRYHNTGSAATAGMSWIGTTQVPPIEATIPREIFSSQRTGQTLAPSQAWDFPVGKGTAITVRLYFAARCACVPGRKFHITIDGVRKTTDYDITAAVGNEVGTMLAYNVVSDGNVDIDLTRVSVNPHVNAIEIVRSPVPTLLGHERNMFKRSYDATTVGARTQVTNTANFPWEGARGGFWVGGTLYFVHGRNFYRMPFDGTTFGPAAIVNPHSDPKWDVALTYSGPEGQTFAGAKPEFHYEMTSATGMFYEAGKVYYTLAGHPTLYSRAFSPDSGTIGAVRSTVTSTVSFADSGGVFVSGGKLYQVSRSTGALSRVDWANGTPSGTPATVSGPAVDSVDWRAKVVFVGP